MPQRHRPVDRWLIDWDQDGTFTGAFDDVSAVWLSDSLRIGCNPSLDGRGVRTMHTHGKLALWNGPHLYDPNSASAVVDETKLRRRNPCRLETDGVVAWEGIAEHAAVVGTGARSVHTLNLTSEDNLRLTRGRKELNRAGGTVTDLAAQAAELWGITLDATSACPLGEVNYPGNGLVFLDNLGRYAGGWVVQDMAGDWHLVIYADTLARSSAHTFGLAYEPDDGYHLLERQGHVRNYAQARGSYWANVDGETTLAAATVELDRHQRVTVNLRVEGGSGRRATGWTRFSVSPGDVAILLDSSITDNSRATVTVQALGYEAAPPQAVRVAGRGNAQNREQTTPRELTITEYGTQDTYGEQELLVPPWSPTDFGNVADYLRPWLRNLSQGPEWLQITYPEWQTTAAKSAALRDHLRPGTAVTHGIVVDDAATSVDTVTMAVTLRGARSRPRLRTAYGLKRRANPPAPLGASIVNISDRTATARVTVPSHAAEQVYARQRIA